MRMVKVRILPPQPRLFSTEPPCRGHFADCRPRGPCQRGSVALGPRDYLAQGVMTPRHLAHAKTHLHAHIGSRYINLGERTSGSGFRSKLQSKNVGGAKKVGGKIAPAQPSIP